MVAMEVPPNILIDLKCSECERYLSQSPVYLQHDGEAVCATCLCLERPAVRNKQYEAVAQLLKFPCRNQQIGCMVTVPFDKTEVHKEICKYRQYVCPIIDSSNCEWIGHKKDLLKHCEEEHHNFVKDNPITLTHDIAKPSEQNFIIRAFQVLFLLHTKVCVASGKIFHAVRYLGLSGNAKNFDFNLGIRGNEKFVLREGQVLNQKLLSIEEDTSLDLEVKDFVNIFGDFSDTIFTITLNQLASAIESCVKCDSLLTMFDFYAEGGWWCENCAPPKTLCENTAQGCEYKDISVKSDKHKQYFCERSYHCRLCKNNIPLGPLLEHYDDAHQNKIYKNDTICRITYTGAVVSNYCLISCVAETALCIYKIYNNLFDIYIYIPVSSAELREFKCTVRIMQVSTGKLRTYAPNLVYNKNWDWYIKITQADFPSWSCVFDVCVNIVKVKI